MTYLVDTDWVADFLKGRRPALDLFEALGPDGLAISIITYGEIQEGILYWQNRQPHEHGFRQFLRWVRVLPLTRTTMQHFARIRGDLRVRGQLIGDMDLLIAATALTHQLTLLTRNVRHFERIVGLQLHRSSEGEQ
jgi:tRNA(fMet)-specific endonuclease VapC